MLRPAQTPVRTLPPQHV